MKRLAVAIVFILSAFGVTACGWEDSRECPDRCTTILDGRGEVLECHCAPEEIAAHCEQKCLLACDPDYDPDYDPESEEEME